jgi:hypothetical protein
VTGKGLPSRDDDRSLLQGSSWLRDAYEAFAPIREKLNAKYTEAEIDDAIDRQSRQ